MFNEDESSVKCTKKFWGRYNRLSEIRNTKIVEFSMETRAFLAAMAGEDGADVTAGQEFTRWKMKNRRKRSNRRRAGN